MTLTNLCIIAAWYSFGWIGSSLLFLLVLFCNTMIYKTLDLENEKNVTNRFRKCVVRLYNYLDFDWTKDDLRNLRVSFPVTCIMAAGAIFGTYMIPVSLAVSLVGYFTILIWYQFQK